jgi:CBS domain-containing protein
MHSIRDVMTGNVRTVDASATIVEAARMLAEAGVGSLPVVEDGRPIGIVTDRDLVVRVLAAGDDPTSVRVRQIVSSPLVSIASDRSVDEAIFLMSSNRIRRLAVVDEGRLTGLVSQADIARHESADVAGLAVARISQPDEGEPRDEAEEASAESFPASDPPSEGSAGVR